MTQENRQDLVSFCEKIEELESSNAVRNKSDNTRVLLCLREENGKPVNYTKNIPRDENQERLIRIMRQLLMNDEKINYYHISNILLMNNQEKEEIIKLKSYWTEILRPSQRQIGLFCNDKMLTNEGIIKIFMYGGFIHTKDRSVREKYLGFQEVMGDLFNFWMFSVLFDLVDVAIRTKKVVEKVL